MAMLENPQLQELLARFRNGPWPARMPFIVSLVFVVLVAHQLAGITWSVVAGSDTYTAAPVPRAETRATTDPERVAGRHLFGRTDARREIVTAEVDAPDTGLNLVLKGVLASSDRDGSRALIAGADGTEKVYAPGASIASGVSLHEVLPDRVLLNRRGTLEALRLPKPGEGGAPARATRDTARMPAQFDNLREAGIGSGDDLAEVVRPQAVMVDGQLHGYRVYPGRDRQRFAALGLRAGDLVRAIDGVALDDPARSIEALQALAGNAEVTLTVERGGERQDVVVRLER